MDATVHKQLLEKLEELGGKMFSDDMIKRHDGPDIIIPRSMSLDDLIRYAGRAREEAFEPIDYSRTYKYRPWDGMYCAVEALRKYFGSVLQKGSMWSAAQLIDVPCDVDEVVQVPTGWFEVPAIPQVQFYFGEARDPELGPVFEARASGPKMYRERVQGVFKLIEDELKLNSIYRGKAFDGQIKPNFIDLSDVDEPIFGPMVEAQLEANIFTPLRHKQALEELGVPLKSAVLLEGTFGVGKTMVLRKAAKVAKSNGWTFIEVRPNRDSFSDALTTAKIYEPAVVAFEDVDTLLDNTSESDRISEILDLFDGMRSKSSKVMLLLTTNHVTSIHKGLMRPGRLDTIINVPTPDAVAIQGMLERFVPAHSREEELDWSAITDAMSGYHPSFVREAANKAVRYAVARTDGESDGVVLSTQDLVDAGQGLRRHFELMESADVIGGEQPLDKALGDVVSRSVAGIVKDSLLTQEALEALGNGRH